MCPLERRTELARGKPLNRGTSQLARTELKRSSSLSPGTARLNRSTPLKAARVKLAAAETGGRGIVIGRAVGGWCEIRVPVSYVCQGQGTDFCHRWGQGTGGPDVASNGLWGCRLCHGWTHGHPIESEARGWMLRSRSDTLIKPVWYQNERWVLLDDEGGVRDWSPDEIQRTGGTS